MMQLSMFDDNHKTVRPKRVKARQLDMFAGGDLFGGGVAKADCPSDRLFDLVLAYPDETEDEAREREAREAHINTLF
jgi:hypothetical protein